MRPIEEIVASLNSSSDQRRSIALFHLGMLGANGLWAVGLIDEIAAELDLKDTQLLARRRGIVRHSVRSVGRICEAALKSGEPITSSNVALAIEILKRFSTASDQRLAIYARYWLKKVQEADARTRSM